MPIKTKVGNTPFLLQQEVYKFLFFQKTYIYILLSLDRVDLLKTLVR